ncbi:hypothetical protein [Alkalicoccus daliensis]|uniref:Uncharacterized protein n=1 Tax=Alkalicoccus daliensis TaxID=745820 RepID=A0A1H0CS87_9BACI|nr:hypothetical protein [Alkalicoccus daliensis]SDN60581.1 hypothetical protein SAMN04488053_102206 [Alkalicoccus daliensis]
MAYRILSFIVLFLFVTVTLYFYTMNSHFVMEAAGGHDHGMIEVPEETEHPPQITAEVKEKEDGTAVLQTTVKHFVFVRNSEGEATFREGHAHVYINGEKEGRLYGAEYPLGRVEEDLDIRVVLSTHDHRLLMWNGAEIEAELVYNAGNVEK